MLVVSIRTWVRWSGSSLGARERSGAYTYSETQGSKDAPVLEAPSRQPGNAQPAHRVSLIMRLFPGTLGAAGGAVLSPPSDPTSGASGCASGNSENS